MAQEELAAVAKTVPPVNEANSAAKARLLQNMMVTRRMDEGLKILVKLPSMEAILTMTYIFLLSYTTGSALPPGYLSSRYYGRLS